MIILRLTRDRYSNRGMGITGIRVFMQCNIMSDKSHRPGTYLVIELLPFTSTKDVTLKGGGV